MGTTALGKVYKDRDIIVQQGEKADGMYVVQDGEVEVLREMQDKKIHLAILGEGDFFGEAPFFERKGHHAGVTRATVQAIGDVRVLTVDKRTILRRIHEDPSLAYRMLQILSRRMQEIEDELTRLVVNG